MCVRERERQKQNGKITVLSNASARNVDGDNMSNRLLNLITCNLHNRHNNSIASVVFFYIIIFGLCVAVAVFFYSFTLLILFVPLCGQIMAVGKLYSLRQFFSHSQNRIKRWTVVVVVVVFFDSTSIFLYPLQFLRLPCRLCVFVFCALSLLCIFFIVIDRCCRHRRRRCCCRLLKLCRHFHWFDVLLIDPLHLVNCKWLFGYME